MCGVCKPAQSRRHKTLVAHLEAISFVLLQSPVKKSAEVYFLAIRLTGTITTTPLYSDLYYLWENIELRSTHRNFTENVLHHFAIVQRGWTSKAFFSRATFQKFSFDRFFDRKRLLCIHTDVLQLDFLVVMHAASHDFSCSFLYFLTDFPVNLTGCEFSRLN